MESAPGGRAGVSVDFRQGCRRGILRAVTCISPYVLVSALVLRVERDGYAPTRADLEALLGSGNLREEIRAALARGAARRPDRPFGEAIAILDAIPGGS
jgi:hypothetical protein